MPLWKFDNMNSFIEMNEYQRMRPNLQRWPVGWFQTTLNLNNEKNQWKIFNPNQNVTLEHFWNCNKKKLWHLWLKISDGKQKQFFNFCHFRLVFKDFSSTKENFWRQTLSDWNMEKRALSELCQGTGFTLNRSRQARTWACVCVCERVCVCVWAM